MNAYKSMQLINKYAFCPECGSDAIGNGEGTLNIDDDTFARTCKCGWSIEIKEK